MTSSDEPATREDSGDQAIQAWNRLVDDLRESPHFEVSRPPDDFDSDG